MITRQDFDAGANAVRGNLMGALPRMINYKKFIQEKVLDIATDMELEDVRDCSINQGMIDKLTKLAKQAMLPSQDVQSLYCAAMAVGTIIKEYEWGTGYLTPDGLFELAGRIHNA